MKWANLCRIAFSLSSRNTESKACGLPGGVGGGLPGGVVSESELFLSCTVFCVVGVVEEFGPGCTGVVKAGAIFDEVTGKILGKVIAEIFTGSFEDGVTAGLFFFFPR
jgi:hypothetical protein